MWRKITRKMRRCRENEMRASVFPCGGKERAGRRGRVSEKTMSQHCAMWAHADRSFFLSQIDVSQEIKEEYFVHSEIMLKKQFNEKTFINKIKYTRRREIRKKQQSTINQLYHNSQVVECITTKHPSSAVIQPFCLVSCLLKRIEGECEVLLEIWPALKI